MEAVSNMLMSGNNVFLKSISKVFQLFQPPRSHLIILSSWDCSLLCGFLITRLQLNVNLMGVQSFMYHMTQRLYIPDFISYLDFFFLLDVG